MSEQITTIEVAQKIAEATGKELKGSGNSFLSIGFYPKGKITIYKGKLDCSGCFDPDAVKVARDIFSSSNVKPYEETKKQDKPHQDYFYGAADEESW